MRENLKFVGAALLVLYGIAALMTFLAGLGDNLFLPPYSRCDAPTRRISYILPFYLVGCWLGEPVGKK